jgi:hypothetical protein
LAGACGWLLIDASRSAVEPASPDPEPGTEPATDIVEADRGYQGRRHGFAAESRPAYGSANATTSGDSSPSATGGERTFVGFFKPSRPPSRQVRGPAVSISLPVR